MKFKALQPVAVVIDGVPFATEVGKVYDVEKETAQKWLNHPDFFEKVEVVEVVEEKKTKSKSKK